MEEEQIYTRGMFAIVWIFLGEPFNQYRRSRAFDQLDSISGNHEHHRVGIELKYNGWFSAHPVND
jgi:hypothetical protein